MWRYLRPAGERMRLRRGTPSEGAAALGAPETAVRFYDSGTAALAAALKASAAAHPVDAPEVLMPAYACPDLVSAAAFAGVRPVLVDFVPDRPWMDLDVLRAQVTANTVAVIAVNFLGIPERLHELVEIARAHSVPLIYDCAQSLEAGVAADEAAVRILSFGRGKPVSLLGGGAVLCSDDGLLAHLLEPEEPAGEGQVKKARFAAGVLAYNLLSRPEFYTLPASLPFLKLGETRFKELAQIGAMPRHKRAYLAANIASQSAGHAAAPMERIRTDLERGGAPGLIDLPTACGVTGAERLLRYPLLMPDARSRDFALKHLRSFGATEMYRSSLPRVPGVGDRVATEEHPRADDFAQRLITLPVHADVRLADSQHMVRIVRSAAQNAEVHA